MAPLTLYWNPFFHIISCKATVWQEHWSSLLYSITNITFSLAEVLVIYQLTDSEFYLVKLWKRLLHFQLQSTCTSQLKKYGERFEPRGHFIRRWNMIFLSSVVLNRAVADGMMLLTTCALACEQALLFGRVKWVSPECVSERRSLEGLGPSLACSREARFACWNRRACSQATCALVIFTVKISCITSVDLWYYWASVMT